MITLFKVLLIRKEGKPAWLGAEFKARSQAVKVGQDIINQGRAKVVVVYRGEKPTHLLVYRPTTYVHLERI